MWALWVLKKLVASSTRRSGGSRNAVNLSIMGYVIAFSSAKRLYEFTARRSTPSDPDGVPFGIRDFSLRIWMHRCHKV